MQLIISSFTSIYLSLGATSDCAMTYLTSIFQSARGKRSDPIAVKIYIMFRCRFMIIKTYVECFLGSCVLLYDE